jgi:predicted metalloprotease with PDZ domain
MTRLVCLAYVVAALAVASPVALAQTAKPISVDVDARDAPRNLLHAHLVIPAKPGPLTLLYPKWLPGEHGPTGPVQNLVDVKLAAGGKPIPWQRDPENMYAFHVDVPAGADAVVADVTFLLPAGGPEGFTSGGSSTPSLVAVSWNYVVLYPQGPSADDVKVAASLRLPAGWKLGTSLTIAREAGGQTTFAPTSLTMLIDSPVLAGEHTRILPLLDKPPVRAFVAADSEAALAPKPWLVQALAKLPAEANALFGAYHYASYTFLLTLSDHVASFGLEHHESSDDRVTERSLIDDDHQRTHAGLLPHEMTHSWNGKYRRPADLAPGSFDKPMHGDLLWVYEGLTEYLGWILTARSGLLSQDDFRDTLALVAAEMDAQKGREWRPLVDTAVAAQVLYGAPNDGAARRRGVDFYPESELIWLEADTIIRDKTGGKASLDDFCRKFHGGDSGTPRVVPYVLADVIAALSQVAPYDWDRFFKARVYATAARAPLGGIETSGWKLAFTPDLPAITDSRQEVDHTTDVRWSLGFIVKKDGLLPDVLPDSPAALAGVAPGSTLLAVNGRRYTRERLREAIAESAKSKGVDLIVEDGEFVRAHHLAYSGGERYPHLVRVDAKPDVLGTIIHPLTGPTPTRPAAKR